MKVRAFTPSEDGNESVVGHIGPGAADHQHHLVQRGEQLDWSEADNGYIVRAVMHCALPDCGYGEQQDWDDAIHTDDVTQWEHPQ